MLAIVFTNLPGDNYVVRGLAPRGFTFTSPANGFLNVALPAGETVAGINFGANAARKIGGIVSVPGSPIARRDSAASLQNSSVAIDVLANDIDFMI